MAEEVEARESKVADGVEQLVTASLNGHVASMARVPDLLDAAFTADGARLLTRTGAGFQVWSLNGAAVPEFAWPESAAESRLISSSGRLMRNVSGLAREVKPNGQRSFTR